MKKLLFVLLFTSFCFAQNINNYRAVIVPLRFDFIRTNNEYRLCTLSKINLTNAGFTVFYANEILPSDFNNRCEILYYDIVKENAFLATKLHIELKDCNGNLIYKSGTGYTKEKDTGLAYSKALDIAFTSVTQLHYKYNNFVSSTPIVNHTITSSVSQNTVVEVKNNSSESSLLYAQATVTGYQLVDASPKVVYKLYKTSRSDLFIASKGMNQGVLIQKDNQWFFEFYESEKLVSEKVAVKF